MGQATFLRRTVAVLALAAMVALAGSAAVGASGRPNPLERTIHEEEVVGSGMWETLLCLGCGASVVAAVTAPLGLMMLGTGGAQFAAACGLQCILAWSWE
jgi:hypothetical protein